MRKAYYPIAQGAELTSDYPKLSSTKA